MSRAPKEAQAEPEGTIAARRLVIGEAVDWIEAAARLKTAGYLDGVIARAETEAAQRDMTASAKRARPAESGSGEALIAARQAQKERIGA